ncbi:MAG: ankyrin repeat domain-containing protein [Cocleimonas sp.]|nr:ankyrin repeat domain-containing protein [Cocleimonas sp.]
MARKRKTLPKDFEELLVTGDLESLKNIFDTCELDAYGGGSYSKRPAIAYDLCPDELVKWLIEQGADINKVDYYDDTPIHQRALSRRSDIRMLLELGADVTINTERSGTPLHVAASYHNAKNAELLLEFGADINEKSADDGLIPLESALQRCSNIDIENTVELAELLLKSGSQKTSRMKAFITEVGETFEFHRSGFNKDYVDATSNALDSLYRLFQVPPVPKRVLHDSKSKIVINEKSWQKQHEELLNILVPSSGYAATAQGEVIRISGRISDEIERNGGVNWGNDYKKMGKAYLKLISTGEALSIDEISNVKSILSSICSLEGNTAHLAEYAVKWVIQNKTPVALSKPDYKR